MAQKDSWPCAEQR